MQGGARRRFGGLGGVEVRTRGKLPQWEVAGGEEELRAAAGTCVRGQRRARTRAERERCWRGEEEESVAAAADAGGSGCGLRRREDAGDQDAVLCGRRVDG